MGAKGCALDNAVCEAFFATLKKELTRRRSWPTRRELETAVFAWIEGWYNRRRLHSTLGYLSPVEFENGTLGKDGAVSPLRGSHPHRDDQGQGCIDQPNVSTETGQVHFVTFDETRDRGVIWPLVRRDDAARDVLDAGSLDRRRTSHRAPSNTAAARASSTAHRPRGRARPRDRPRRTATCRSRRPRRSRTTPGGPRAATRARRAATGTTAHGHTRGSSAPCPESS